MRADLKAETKAALPTAGAPKVMQRTSAVGQLTAAQVASRLATEPPMQKPTVAMRLGGVSPVNNISGQVGSRAQTGVAMRLGRVRPMNNISSRLAAELKSPWLCDLAECCL